MRNTLKALIGICLILGAQAAGGSGVSPTAVDHRIAIPVTNAERNRILFEMREFLHHMFNIHNALSRGDMEAVSISAKPMAEAFQTRLPPELRNKAPVAFQEMSHGMHEIFAVIARDAKAKGNVSQTLGQLAEAFTYCSGCHDTYRLQVRNTR